jgi:Domain of unknown function (DUF309)
VTRDRDPAGRARNARPRDALGRPLGRSENSGDARIPDDLVLAGADAAQLADELLRAGRPFHAHEVLEASWKFGPAQERDLWQGLAQIAVGLTHAHRGNARGAITLLGRGAQRVRTYQAQARDEDPAHQDSAHQDSAHQDSAHQDSAHQDSAHQESADRDRPYGIDLGAVLTAADDLAARIGRDGLAGIPAADLRPGLTPGP